MKRFFWNAVATIALLVIVLGIIFSTSSNLIRKDAALTKPSAPPDRSASDALGDRRAA
ncbi:MAG TPA: hypothetical protein VEM36_14245 [Xanthobacteraceae bacterium]|nr:hypothetical protein [Xanthobacteraceae bacterium]